jgi:quercetin dioxygenase-like cupin family protein
MMQGFFPFKLEDGAEQHFKNVRVLALAGGEVRWEEGTAFGMVFKGRGRLEWKEESFSVREGCFFVAPGKGGLKDCMGQVIVVSGYTGLFQLGGPLEPQGRLNYIDGCTDTLLVCPPKCGDPSLNHLHIPAKTDQSPHTHASDRIGIILRGSGFARTPLGWTPLQPGMGWWIPAHSEHSFVTENSSLDVIAWHPDSVFGPTDEVHPMKSGTILKY